MYVCFCSRTKYTFSKNPPNESPLGPASPCRGGGRGGGWGELLLQRVMYKIMGNMVPKVSVTPLTFVGGEKTGPKIIGGGGKCTKKGKGGGKTERTTHT